MKSKKSSHHKVSKFYNKLNKRVVWLPLKENALVSTSRELYPNTSMAVDPLFIDPSLTSKHINSLNREVAETLIALSPFSKSLSSHKTPVAIQPADINIPRPHGQDMENSAKPLIKTSAILYDNNQLVDLDLWNSLFSLVLLLKINKFLSCDT